MKVDVVFLPALLKPDHLRDRVVVVFDVLRATTTMIAAIAAGVSEIRVFDDIGAAGAHGGSPSTAPACSAASAIASRRPASTSATAPRRSTHPSTEAAPSSWRRPTAPARSAAQAANELLVGALVNASAVARHLIAHGRDATLLCAGTAGEIATEDVIGAGAVLDALLRRGQPLQSNDAADIAVRLFRSCQTALPRTLRQTRGRAQRHRGGPRRRHRRGRRDGHVGGRGRSPKSSGSHRPKRVALKRLTVARVSNPCERRDVSGDSDFRKT